MIDGVTGHILLVAAILIGLFNALGMADVVSDPFAAGFIPFTVACLAAFLLQRRDRTPDSGQVFITAALLNTAVQMWGGASGPAGFLYPILFLWMKRDSISGPVLTVALALAVVEFSAPVIRATELRSGGFDPGALIGTLFGALVSGIIPLVSLFAVEYLKEETARPVEPPENPGRKKADQPEFPDDVARSLIPVLKKSTGANGIFLFVRDERGVSTLNEYVVGRGMVAARYLAGPDDPVIQMLDSCHGDTVHTEAEKLSIGGSPGLPWYLNDGKAPWVTIVQFRRDGELRGFMVLDFDTAEKRQTAAPLLVDSAFLLSVSWERCRVSGSDGFLAVCEEMATISDIKGGVHRLISRILKTFPDTTVSVAILGDGGILRVFESLGPFSEGRAGREFNLSEGLAGMAVTRREPMRRLRMGVGQKAIRTFGDSDDPRRLVGSVCAVPLEDMGAVLGVLTVESGSEQYFAPEDLFLLTAFATVFSLAVSRQNLKESLRRVRENDRITGFPLLSVFYATLADMVRGVRSRAMSITVLAVDISEFSSVNENYGYSIGDAVLGMTARRLRKAVGANAVLSRFGADSFLVCLQGVDRVSAEAFAARIHEEFADSPMHLAVGEIPIRVCIGGAVSHVDKMIKKLPEIALSMARGISGRPGMTSVTEVGQFYESGK